MNRTTVRSAIAVSLTLFSFGYAASAHHSTALQFDIAKEVTITGAIAKLEWRNPHSWLYVEVENEEGRLELWAVEFGSANRLYRRGWRQDDLPFGSEVTIHGFPARDGSRQMAGEEVTLAGGRSLFSGSGPQDR